MKEMVFQLCTAGNGPLYVQIYEHIRGEIRKGKLLPEERLPSTRFLAEYLQVARSTVDYAYGQRLSEGYIEARPCRGYFVCPIEELLLLEEEREAPASGETEPGRQDIQEEERIRVDFSPYDIDLSGFPFSVWKKITKNILTCGNRELFAKGEVQGDPGLRQTICRYLHSSRGVNCRPEQIIVGAGNDYLLMLLEKILGRDICIAMENPTYIRSYRIFRSFAYRITAVDMDEFGMRADKLAQSEAAIAYVMPSHQFPAGTVMPIGRRLELLKWADGGEDRYLIEDDYDSEFRFCGRPVPALQASDRHGRVIYIGTFSKAIAPAIRISFMVLPDALLEKYRESCSFYSCTVSRIDQNILDEFIREGYFERHLNKMRKIYRGKHELLLECLQPLKEGFSVSGENAGLHLVLTSRRGGSEAELVEKALKKRVKVYGLSESMMEEAPGSAAVLLGFGGLSEEGIREGVRLLEKAWIPKD